MNDSFISVVTDPKDFNLLQVRARRYEDLVRLIETGREPHHPNDTDSWISDITETLQRDYRFRVSLPRNVIADLVANQIENIYYHNFKDSVEDHKRASAYSRVWSDLYELDGRFKEKLRNQSAIIDNHFPPKSLS